jgi:alcohol dehydrogenase class IV
MNPFEFLCVPRIVFGCGTSGQLAELTASMGKHALLVSNAGQPGDGGAIDLMTTQFSAGGIETTVFRQTGEPTVSDVDQAVTLARQAGCDVVIGLGGGSAIDAAKAVAGLLSNGGSPLDYMEVIGQGLPLTRPAAPWIAVPTTAGTGAEVTKNAVLASPAQHFKASLRSEHLLARIALIDPELAVPVSPQVTACSGMDALCQLIESYTSNRAQPISDALAIKGIELAAGSLTRVFADGRDLEARQDMALAAMLSGVTLANVGLGAVHGFAAPLGAHLPIPHGAVCAALLPHVVRANITALQAESAEHPCLGRYDHVGRMLTGDHALEPAEARQAAVQFLGDLARQLQIPPLATFGLQPRQIPELVALARKASSMRYNPVVLSDEALTEILTAAS